MKFVEFFFFASLLALSACGDEDASDFWALTTAPGNFCVA